MSKLLIVEDDMEIAELERDYLEASDFEVDIETDGGKAEQRIMAEAYDLVILDLMLPHTDGFTLCRRLRKERDIPIIIVSARQTDVDKVRGFGLGADDYLTKPFSPSELVARVKAHLARYRQLTQKTALQATVLSSGELRLEVDSHRAYLGDQELELPHREFELLQFFMEHPGQVFGREQIFESLWGMEAMGNSATVTVHIGRLREKIEPDKTKPHYIETVRGVGYRFRKG